MPLVLPIDACCWFLMGWLTLSYIYEIKKTASKGLYKDKILLMYLNYRGGGGGGGGSIVT